VFTVFEMFVFDQGSDLDPLWRALSAHQTQ